MAYFIDARRCTACGTCVEMCAYQAISQNAGRYVIEPDNCRGCSICADFCPAKAIQSGE